MRQLGLKKKKDCTTGRQLLTDLFGALFTADPYEFIISVPDRRKCYTQVL